MANLVNLDDLLGRAPSNEKFEQYQCPQERSYYARALPLISFSVAGGLNNYAAGRFGNASGDAERVSQTAADQGSQLISLAKQCWSVDRVEHKHAGSVLSPEERVAYAQAALFLQDLCLPTLEQIGDSLEPDHSQPSPLEELAMGHNFIMAALARRIPLPCLLWLSLHGDSLEDVPLATSWDRVHSWETDPSIKPAAFATTDIAVEGSEERVELDRQVMSNLVQLVKEAAQSREPAQVHVALLLAGSLAHFFCHDNDAGRRNGDFIYEQGGMAALALLVKLNPRAMAYNELARVFFCSVMTHTAVSQGGTPASEAILRTRSRLFTQMGVCQAAADAFLGFNAGFIGEHRASVISVMECIVACTWNGWGTATHNIPALLNFCLRVHVALLGPASGLVKQKGGRWKLPYSQKIGMNVIHKMLGLMCHLAQQLTEHAAPDHHGSPLRRIEMEAEWLTDIMALGLHGPDDEEGHGRDLLRIILVSLRSRPNALCDIVWTHKALIVAFAILLHPNPPGYGLSPVKYEVVEAFLETNVTFRQTLLKYPQVLGDHPLTCLTCQDQMVQDRIILLHALVSTHMEVRNSSRLTTAQKQEWMKWLGKDKSDPPARWNDVFRTAILSIMQEFREGHSQHFKRGDGLLHVEMLLQSQEWSSRMICQSAGKARSPSSSHKDSIADLRGVAQHREFFDTLETYPEDKPTIQDAHAVECLFWLELLEDSYDPELASLAVNLTDCLLKTSLGAQARTVDPVSRSPGIQHRTLWAAAFVLGSLMKRMHELHPFCHEDFQEEDVQKTLYGHLACFVVHSTLLKCCIASKPSSMKEVEAEMNRAGLYQPELIAKDLLRVMIQAMTALDEECIFIETEMQVGLKYNVVELALCLSGALCQLGDGELMLDAFCKAVEMYALSDKTTNIYHTFVSCILDLCKATSPALLAGGRTTWERLLDLNKRPSCRLKPELATRLKAAAIARMPPSARKPADKAPDEAEVKSAEREAAELLRAEAEQEEEERARLARQEEKRRKKQLKKSAKRREEAAASSAAAGQEPTAQSSHSEPASISMPVNGSGREVNGSSGPQEDAGEGPRQSPGDRPAPTQKSGSAGLQPQPPASSSARSSDTEDPGGLDDLMWQPSPASRRKGKHAKVTSPPQPPLPQPGRSPAALPKKAAQQGVERTGRASLPSAEPVGGLKREAAKPPSGKLPASSSGSGLPRGGERRGVADAKEGAEARPDEQGGRVTVNATDASSSGRRSPVLSAAVTNGRAEGGGSNNGEAWWDAARGSKSAGSSPRPNAAGERLSPAAVSPLASLEAGMGSLTVAGDASLSERDEAAAVSQLQPQQPDKASPGQRLIRDEPPSPREDPGAGPGLASPAPAAPERPATLQPGESHRLLGNPARLPQPPALRHLPLRPAPPRMAPPPAYLRSSPLKSASHSSVFSDDEDESVATDVTPSHSELSRARLQGLQQSQPPDGRGNPQPIIHYPRASSRGNLSGSSIQGPQEAEELEDWHGGDDAASDLDWVSETAHTPNSRNTAPELEAARPLSARRSASRPGSGRGGVKPGGGGHGRAGLVSSAPGMPGIPGGGGHGGPHRPKGAPPTRDAARAPGRLISEDELEHYCHCPISMEIMTDPVIADDGHTYERSCIMSWLALHDTSPLTNQPMESKRLLPNHMLRQMISAFFSD